MAQITGIFKAWLNVILQLQLAFMIETYSRNILLTSSNPRENLKRGTSGQKARGKKGGNIDLSKDLPWFKICRSSFQILQSIQKAFSQYLQIREADVEVIK